MIERWLRYQEIETLRQALRNTRLSYEQNERLLRHRVAELTHVAQSFKAQLLDAGIQPALPMPADIRDEERDEKESSVISTGTSTAARSAAAQQREQETVIIAEDTSSDTSAPAGQTVAGAVSKPASDSDTTAQEEAEQTSQAVQPEETKPETADTEKSTTQTEAHAPAEEQEAPAVQKDTTSNAQQDTSSVAQSDAASAEEDTASSSTEETSYPVQEVEGIGPVYSKRLGEKGIRTTADLIEKTASEEAAADIAKHVKVSVTVLRRWVNMSHLMKVPGIQGQYAKLLELAEVHNCEDLAKQSARSLTRKLRVINELHHITQHPPKESEVRNWIQYARTHQQAG